jgi:hypothetical protein
MAAPTTVHGNGMVVATGLPQQEMGHKQNMEGGPTIYAVNKTLARTAEQAAHAKAAGVTQKGGAISVPHVAESGTIPGVSFGGNHKALIDMKNQLSADSVYDNLAGGQPYKVGGRKRRRKTNGRRKSRNSMGTSRKHTRRTRRKRNLRKR